MVQKYNAQTVPINSSSSGNVTIIANPSKSAFMYIWELAIVVGGTCNLTLYNGGGALTGAMPMLSNGSIFRADTNTPMYTIDPGASFVVNDSVGVQKSGWCKYSN